MSERKTEQGSDTSVAKEGTGKNRPVEDSEAEGVVGGTTKEQYDHWHKLPDGSGSGAGE